jgi:hypothetical protein
VSSPLLLALHATQSTPLRGEVLVLLALAVIGFVVGVGGRREW